MAGLNSLGLGAYGAYGAYGRAAGMIPGMGGAKVPGPTSGITPYMQQIGGAIPGQAVGGLAGMFMSNILAKKKKKQQATTVPTAPVGNGSATTPAEVGRGLATKPAKAAYIGY